LIQTSLFEGRRFTPIEVIGIFIQKATNLKNIEIKKKKVTPPVGFEKSYASSGIRTRNPWGLRLRNTCVIVAQRKLPKTSLKNPANLSKSDYLVKV